MLDTWCPASIILYGGTVDLKQEIDAWKKKIGLDKLKYSDTGEVDWALNIGRELSSMEPEKIEAAMLILSNLRFTVAYQMGVAYAYVKYYEANGPHASINEWRIKLNIIKPYHDAIEAKVAVLKKIYDRRIRELMNASSSRR